MLPHALTPARTWLRYGGPDAAPVITYGPLPQTSDLMTGWYMIDVESPERSVGLAAHGSSAPGPGGSRCTVDRSPGGHVPGALGVVSESVVAFLPRLRVGLWDPHRTRCSWGRGAVRRA